MSFCTIALFQRSCGRSILASSGRTLNLTQPRQSLADKMPAAQNPPAPNCHGRFAGSFRWNWSLVLAMFVASSRKEELKFSIDAQVPEAAKDRLTLGI